MSFFENILTFLLLYNIYLCRYLNVLRMLNLSHLSNSQIPRTFFCPRYPSPKSSPSGRGLTLATRAQKWCFALAKLDIIPIFADAADNNKNHNTMKKTLLLMTAVALMAVGCTEKRDADELRAEKLMAKMTLAEKIGQLNQFVPKNSIVTGPDGSPVDVKNVIKEGMCGSMLNVWSPKEIIEYQKLAVDSSRLGIPILFGHDIIHGCRTTFPENIGISCSWDPAMTEEVARISAAEATAFGLAWTFSPMCDVAIDPRWGRVSEGSGEDPYLSGQLSAAMVRGYQGDDLSAGNTILSCVKHFAAYSAAEAGRDYNTVDMSEMMFRERHLPSYKAAIDAGALSVMSSFNDFDGIPASGNKWLLTDLLRGELGFKGFVVSDYCSINEMINHRVVADKKEAAELALNAGLNMDMVDGDYYKFAEELVREGRVSEAQIDRLCKDILTVKFKLGLFDDPFRYGGEGRWEKETWLPEYLETARKVARSSMVLLKNEEEVLPLKGSERIALIGPAADSRSEMTGTWAGFADYNKPVSFFEGLKARFPHNDIKCEKGCNFFDPIEGGISKAVAAARGADVVLMTLGLPNAYSGEATSMANIDIPSAQKELFKAVKATGKPIVILLVTGRPMTIAEESDAVAGLLVTWHPGIMGGTALADIVSGDYNPSGRLTMTFPLCLGQVPIHYNAKSTGRPRKTPTNNAKYVSRYMRTPNEPLFAFGEGLSYTEFAYSDLEVLNPKAKLGETVKVRVKVSNVGKRDGEEVAQLYIRDVIGSRTRPDRELKGFKKISLKAGESATVDFDITPESRSFFRADKTWGEEAGDFDVFIGHDSHASLKGIFTIAK